MMISLSCLIPNVKTPFLLADALALSEETLDPIYTTTVWLTIHTNRPVTKTVDWFENGGWAV